MRNISDVSVKKGILIAFGELFLKSEGVRRIFRDKLSQNIFLFLKRKNIDFKIFPFHERIFVALPVEALSGSEKRRRETDEIKKALKVMRNVFGIAWFADCLFFEKTNLKEFSDFLGKNYKKWLKEKETFALRLKLEKNFLKESREKVIALLAKNIKRKVNLSRPKREIFIEVRSRGWSLYFRKIKGAGGLPSGSSGKVLSLVSGGIDSPVAIFLLAKRGAENIWLHFHSFPLVSRISIEKVKELAKIFLNFQPRLKVYFLPFAKAQMEVKSKIPAKYRILVYRRLMLKIAEIIAKKEKCLALVTGESLGQVSSQTLPNINIVERGLKIPVFRPLIGMDKEEIINLAKETKTFSISIKPQEDCCTLFTPKHSTAEGRLEEIKKLEKELNIKKIIQDTLKGTELAMFDVARF
ncbi:tRNA 4-thiouridine(8) synthase ThiI [Patescibacteria group bacterium]|nr:tRNA 4-thiouridine(8) synthase ThiI [Patescibacteria group bacterium]MBU4481683.1 tRNA 4-thiouridine(8) synthase ThiI [Patescibacteria group bacterium]